MNTVSIQDWTKFLKKFPNSHLLQTGGWGRLKARFNWKVVHITSEGSGAQILFKSLPLGFCWGYIPRGPVGDPDEDLWRLIESECQRRHAVFLKVEPDQLKINDFPIVTWPSTFRIQKSIHTIQPRRSLILNLDGSEDDILARMKQKTRYNIRLAERKGIQVHSSDDVRRFYQLLEETGQRDEFGIHSESYYQQVYNVFAPEHSCRLLFAEFDGELLSAAMVFANGERSWYFYGASSNQQRNLMAPYAVQWEAIRWAKSKRCKEYDLWGVPDENHEYLEAEFMNRSDGLWGVYRFKRGFGGTLTRTVGAWDIVFNPVLYYFYLRWVEKNKLDL